MVKMDLGDGGLVDMVDIRKIDTVVPEKLLEEGLIFQEKDEVEKLTKKKIQGKIENFWPNYFIPAKKNTLEMRLKDGYGTNGSRRMVEERMMKNEIAKKSVDGEISSNLNRKLDPKQEQTNSKRGAKSKTRGGRWKLTEPDSSQPGIGKFFLKINGNARGNSQGSSRSS